LKWRCFDKLERGTMILGGFCLAGFVTSVFCDVVTRTIGHPWLWLQEVTSTSSSMASSSAAARRHGAPTTST